MLRLAWLATVSCASFALNAAQPPLPPADNATWVQHCGECHILYHPALLTERSWTKLMDSLTRHFGRNVGLSPDAKQTITRFLTTNAANRADHPLARATLAEPNAWITPVRISELAWFKQTHASVRQAKHLAECLVCHQRAERGDFAVLH